MKRLHPAIVLLLLVIVLYAGDRLIGRGLQSIFINCNFCYTELYKGNLQHDIVILGDSRGRAYHAPSLEQKLGVSCFNLSYNSMDAVLLDAFFCDYLDHNAPPKMLIVEVSCSGESIRQHLHSIKVLYSLSDRMRSILATNNKKEYNICALSNIYRYNSEFFMRAVMLFESDQGWMTNGVASPDVIQVILAVKDRQMNQPVDREREALLHIKQTAEEAGCTVTFVMNPYMPGYFPPGVTESYCAQLSNYIGPIWNYSGALDDFSLFVDGYHINLTGSRVLIDKQMADGFYDPVLK